MVKLNEDTLLTGCADGLVRVVRILPNEIMGVLGNHTLTSVSPSTSEPTRASLESRQGGVDRLALSSDKSLLAGVSSFDEKITIFQLEPAWKLLEKKGEGGSEEQDEEDGEKVSGKKRKTKRKLVADLRGDHGFFSDL
ncbi:g-protein beta [Cystoisospora suis]|uniref:G-protein beta n=1 Tax=Cystoisospora suis TaxID=483139 RepID=A0A2C6LCP7_9APIC|nr:g-protein beta [Cystoisospora suis]